MPSFSRLQGGGATSTSIYGVYTVLGRRIGSSSNTSAGGDIILVARKGRGLGPSNKFRFFGTHLIIPQYKAISLFMQRPCLSSNFELFIVDWMHQLVLEYSNRTLLEILQIINSCLSFCLCFVDRIVVAYLARKEEFVGFYQASKVHVLVQFLNLPDAIWWGIH
jgi:hypothetical protein